jgi:hypothetical protein
LRLQGAAEFARCVHALRPWLGTLVFAGGWAHRLHREHALAHPPEYQPIRTLDADVAFSAEEPLGGSLETALSGAGFSERLFGELFGPSLADLHQLWSEEVAPAIGPKTARRALARGRELFAGVTDAIREAARIPQDRKLTPEDNRAACTQGLQTLLVSPEE